MTDPTSPAAAAIAAAMGGGQLGAGAGPPVGGSSYFVAPTQVWMGLQANPSTGYDLQDRKPMNTDAAKAYFYTGLSTEERAALGQQLFGAGLISDPNNIDMIYKHWDAAVDQAALFYNNGSGKKMSPWDVLNMKVFSELGPDGKPKAPGGGSSSSTSYNIPSKEDAAYSIKALFKGAVGRAPTEEEISKYTTMMVGLAKKNPSRSTSTSDGTGNSTSESYSGISDAGMQSAVQTDLQHTSEYGAYQAATTYFNALQAAIASPV